MVTVEGFVCTTGDKQGASNSHASQGTDYHANPQPPQYLQRYDTTEDWLIYHLKRVGWTNTEVGSLLGRTRGSVKNRAARLNLMYQPPTTPMPLVVEDILERVIP